MTSENENGLGEMQMVPVGATGAAPDTVALDTAPADEVTEKKKPGRKPGQKNRVVEPNKETTAALDSLMKTDSEILGDAVSESIEKFGRERFAKSLTQDGDNEVLGVFPMNPGSVVPEKATAGSAAFDVRANFVDVGTVTVYTATNKKTETAVRDQYGVLSVILQPRSRAMIPTGLIFDIPEGFKLGLHARSGESLKNGKSLANGVAVIDSDYVEQTYVLIQNNSDLRVEIVHGDRIAQASLERVIPTLIVPLTEAPGRKTTRSGGLGSTGAK